MNSNFTLTFPSNCRDAGNPSPLYFDTDGSRNDNRSPGGSSSTPTTTTPSTTAPGGI